MKIHENILLNTRFKFSYVIYNLMGSVEFKFFLDFFQKVSGMESRVT